MMTTGVSGALHALAKSGSIFSIVATRLASFRASSVGFPLDIGQHLNFSQDIPLSPETSIYRRLPLVVRTRCDPPEQKYSESDRLSCCPRRSSGLSPRSEEHTSEL